MADSSSVEKRSKKKKSSQKSKKKKEEAVKETSPPPGASATTQDEAKIDSPPRTSASPDPNCSICLGKLENKSFTDSCFHMFCFVCLLEWSKVKNECPLCKQSFKSIIHNVRSYEDYDQYHLSLYARPHTPEHPYSRNFRYRTTLTEDRVFNLRNRVIGNPNTDPETVLQLQAIGAPRNYPVQYEMARQNWNRRRQASTSDFRRRIYTNGMRLTGIRGANNRFRECSPEFFTRNPALTHRLVPWLNRELNALFYNEELSVQFCLELIMGLIKRFEISSEEFYQHLSPFMRRHTRQFMREFESFARCPYCMVVYDKKVVYEHVAESVSSDSSTVNSISDDDSDVQFISSEAAPSGNRTNEYINLPDISSEIQVTSTVDSPRGSNFLQNSGWQSPTPGPSWSFDPPSYPPARQKSFIPSLKRSVRMSDSEIDSSPDSLSSAGSDVQVVAYDKPWEERSPIHLSSETEMEENVVKEKNKTKKKKKKSESNSEVLPSTSAPPPMDLSLVRYSSVLQFDTTPLSPDRSHRRKSHKSRSWRNSHHYRNRANTLFHRRSTSPEMSDSGRRKIPGSDRDYESHHRRKRKHKRSRTSETVGSLAAAPQTSMLDFPSSSNADGPSTSKGHSPEKRRRRERRSPSVEIVSVHKKKKKHKKHKHKHSSKHSKMKSSVVTIGNTEHPSQEDTDAYEDASQTLIPELSSSLSTSETSGSIQSFVDVVSGNTEPLNPVEIASNIAQRNEYPVSSEVTTLGSDGDFDLMAVNLEEVDDEALKQSLNSELPSTTSSKNFKKHPTGHKKSRITNQQLPELATSIPSTSIHQGILPPLSSVMRGDPLMNRTEVSASERDGLAFYSNFLQSFGHAFSDFSPHAWHRRPSIPLIASDPKYYNRWLHTSSSLASSMLPLTTTESSDIVDLDSLPLDLRCNSGVSNSLTLDSYRSNGAKPSTVTSAQTTSLSSDDSVIMSPGLDIVNVNKEGGSSLQNSVTGAVTSSQTVSVSSDESVMLSPTLDIISVEKEPSSASAVMNLSDNSNPEIVNTTAGNSDKLILKDSEMQSTSLTMDDSDLDVCFETVIPPQSSDQNNSCDKNSNNDSQIQSVSFTPSRVDKVVSQDDGHSSDSTIIQGDLDIGDKWDVDPEIHISATSSRILDSELNLENRIDNSDFSVDKTLNPELENSISEEGKSNNLVFCDALYSSLKSGSNPNKLPQRENAAESVNLFTSEPSSKMLDDNSTSCVNLDESKTKACSTISTNVQSDLCCTSVGQSDSVALNNTEASTSSQQNSQFWKRRLLKPLVNSDWRNDESSNETEDSESSSTDSYEYDSLK